MVGVSVPTIREQPFLFLTALGHDGGPLPIRVHGQNGSSSVNFSDTRASDYAVHKASLAGRHAQEAIAWIMWWLPGFSTVNFCSSRSSVPWKTA